MSSSLSAEKCGLLLGTHYEIIEKCLSNLEPVELARVARVCKAWNKVGKKIIAEKSRRPLTVVSDVELPLMKDGIPAEAVKDSFQHCLGYRSTLHLSFITEQCINALDLPGLRQYLSPLCRSFCVPANGIIGTKIDGGVDTFIPSRRDKCNKRNIGMSSVLFPSIPGMQIYTFHGSADSFQDYEFQNESLNSGPMKQIIPDNEIIKCAVLVCFESPETAAEIHENLVKRQEEPFAFAGYFAADENRMLVDYGERTERLIPAASGILFTGANVEAASVVIKGQTIKDITEAFEKLKSCNFPERNSVCLVFSCVGRKKTKKEVELYQSIFPNIPLVGCTGYGEFGTDFFPNMKKEQPSSNKKVKTDILHSFASAYVMIHSKC